MINRRNFLTSAVATPIAVKLGQVAYANATDKPRKVGLIGSGWYGKCDLLQLLNVEPVEVVSLCDVDSKLLSEAADLFEARQKSGNRPRTYANYLDQLRNHEHDIILVATPDHWHALPMIAAADSGAHVYCQKPTGVDVLESKAMLDAARRNNVTVQIGTQRRSTTHLIEAKRRIVDEGLLGDIAHVDICCYYHMRSRKTLTQAPDKVPPEYLDWEAWTGPAPMKPFNDIVHPRGWRGFLEYSNGIVGDMCVHMDHMTRWMLGLGWPDRISSDGGIFVEQNSRANTTDTQTATFHFDELNVVWNHRCWGDPPDKQFPWSSIIYGSKGTLKLSVNRYEFIPRGNGSRMEREALVELDKFPSDQSDKEKWDMELHVAEAIRGHMRDFLKAIDEGTRPVADIEEGHISSASCFLANIAMQTGSKLIWNAEAHRVENDEVANGLLAREYRAPYKHPGIQ